MSHRAVGDTGASRPTEVFIQVKYDNGETETVTVPHPDAPEALSALKELRHAGTG
jgi:hypothetical protein